MLPIIFLEYIYLKLNNVKTQYLHDLSAQDQLFREQQVVR